MNKKQGPVHNSQFTIHNSQFTIPPILRLRSGQLLQSSNPPASLRTGLLLFHLPLLLLLLTLAACGPKALTPEQQIREYIFVHQPVTGSDFVAWANVALADYPSRRIYRALYDQGQIQAEEGHPNAVATLSFAARAWAEEKNLTYNPADWLAMQQQAIANLRDDPGQINLWPTPVPE
jgi:hypothetical protein